MFWGDDTEFKALENQNKICSAMSDAEKNLQVRLDGKVKRSIAQVTSLSVDDVNDVVAKFKQMKGFHKFLKDRRARNEPMPESRDDLMEMYKIERPAFLM